MEVKDLKEAVEKLNASGLLEKKLVLPKKGDVVAAFMAAAETADAAAEKAKGELPDEVVKAYDLCKGEKKAAVEAAQPPARPDKKKKVVKTAPKKEKGLGSMDLMKSLLKSKASDKEITQVFMAKFAKKGVTDSDFVSKRIEIYKKLAKK